MLNYTDVAAGDAATYIPTFLERHWLGLFQDSSYPALKLALVLFAWMEIVFFGRFLPYYITDQIPFFQKYKIQDTKPNTPELYWKCVKSIILSQIFVQHLMLLFHPTAIWLGMRFSEVPFPHYGPLYKHVHKLHHDFSAPFGIAHPIETVVLGQGFFIGPVMLLMLGVDVHVVTKAIWLAVRLIDTVDVHAGYDFPWALHKWMPFFGGADFHDYHHMAFKGNYSSSFRWWDWLFGTDAAYNAWRARQSGANERHKVQ
ncbi:C-4 sterol methyl oxidase [Geranomyces variabilis]|uniref:C-4 sterol methyl oxidase n=1 Tax=Geranomyces variabilis TaxID=109894 RepID=A0AAD5XNF5_9FUNG|nr:C-4 sterol methyl oxidase [Geranomyces variabilis]